MVKDKCVTYNQLNSFLEKNSNVLPAEILIKEAQNYFERKNLFKLRENLFPKDYWVLNMPDDVFEEYCQHMPIRMDNFNQNHLEDINYGILRDGYKCYMYRYLTSYQYPEHTHSFFEVCYAWKGTCKQYCNGMAYNMNQGDFLIIPPGVQHFIEIDNKDSLIFNLVIPKELFHTTLFDVLLQNHPVSFLIRNCLFNEKSARCMLINSPREKDAIGERRIIKILTYEFYQISPQHGMMANASISLLFGIIIGSNSFGFSFGNVEYNDSVIRILDYLNNNYRIVTLNSLSQYFGYNESYMSRLIKKATGMTFSQLIRAIRIAHSVQMLDCKEFSLQKISDVVGYSDIGSYVRAFKKENGIGPKDYRDNKRKQYQNI